MVENDETGSLSRNHLEFSRYPEIMTYSNIGFCYSTFLKITY